MNIDLKKTQQYLEWLKDKLYLNAMASSAQNRTVFRGQVYRCKFGVGIGSEESKERPCVILQSDSANKSSPNTIVAPITHTQSALSIVVPIFPKIDEQGDTILDENVLLGNITCISKARLGEYVANLSIEEMQKIDKAISLSLSLYHYYQSLENKYNDKLKYIDKLKSQRDFLQSNINQKQKQLEELQSLLNQYHFLSLTELSEFLKNFHENK